MALDEKTPLLRSNAALAREGTRLLKHIGYEAEDIYASIGLEQEMFLVPRDAYYKRPDLQLTGRTLIGADAPRGQEMCDHYMGPLSSVTPALAAMQEMQEECWRVGIPLKTRHREVAPGQFEFAPLFGSNTTQVDQNIIVMQIIEEVAARHGLAALLQEKPFNNVNGSGKHNNWSIWTSSGANLLSPQSINEKTGNPLAFPIIMSALIAAVDEHGDLMRMSIASPGNDFRLGACEAPPAIVSTYLGDDMTKYLDNFRDGHPAPYHPGVKTLDLGTSSVLPFEVPAEDRNRTSPFPYGGGRFEFRAVGSAQNVSLVNTVLNTIAAEKFGEFATACDEGADPADYARSMLDKHWKVIFNGDNYDEANQQMLTDKGLWRIDSGVESIHKLVDSKNTALFEKMGVLKPEECKARADILHDHYTGTVELEALCLKDMINQHIVPACKKNDIATDDLASALSSIKEGMANIHAAESSYDKAKLARVLRLETMVDIRAVCDGIEEIIPAKDWTLATYKELLFMDSHVDAPPEAMPMSDYE
jgi:glutamine synthetase